MNAAHENHWIAQWTHRASMAAVILGAVVSAVLRFRAGLG
jgi:hypothetical protein